MVRLTDCLDMIIVVDLDIKPQNKQTNDPKLLDRQVQANSEDPDHVFQPVCIFWMHLF